MDDSACPHDHFIANVDTGQDDRPPADEAPAADLDSPHPACGITGDDQAFKSNKSFLADFNGAPLSRNQLGRRGYCYSRINPGARSDSNPQAPYAKHSPP
ncbi:MAG: hypothetical protein ACO1OX_11420 [Novosphingobium sp.]